jgi:hypothetical protein
VGIIPGCSVGLSAVELRTDLCVFRVFLSWQALVFPLFSFINYPHYVSDSPFLAYRSWVLVSFGDLKDPTKAKESQEVLLKSELDQEELT